MNDDEILMGSGLTQIESKTYLELLRLGPSTAYKIAKEANLHKANCYDALKSLVSKGLTSFISKEGHNLYQTTDPDNLRLFLKRKEEKLNEILPKLKLMEGMVSEKSDASIHKGVSAFMNLLYSVLEYKKPIIVYGIPKAAPITVKLYIDAFHNERIKRKIKMTQIYNYDASERIQELQKFSLTETRSLPKSVESSASTLVCGPEVQIAAWIYNSVKIIRIIDQDIANSYRSYFEFLWKQAE